MIGSVPNSGEPLGSVRNVLSWWRAAAETACPSSVSAFLIVSSSGRHASTTLVRNSRGGLPLGVGELGSRCAAAGTVKELLHRLRPSVPPAPTRQLADRPGLRWGKMAAGDAPQQPLHGGQHEAPFGDGKFVADQTSPPCTPVEHSTHIVKHHGVLVTTVANRRRA
jgi:hypothetical protein